MILWLIRGTFVLALIMASFTGAAVFAGISLLAGAILFFIDGWSAIIAYFVFAMIVAWILHIL